MRSAIIRVDDLPEGGHDMGTRTRQAGFTLIEMMVVMVIIGLLMALVGPNLIKQEEKSKVKAARAQIEMLGTSLDTFRLDVGRYPSTQEGLAALRQRPFGVDRGRGPYLKKDAPKDPGDRPDVDRRRVQA